LKPNDRQRLCRALEVLEGTGHPLSHWQAEAQSQAFLMDVAVERHLAQVPREELYARAERRFDQMMVAGALEEARALIKYGSVLPIMKAIGVPELIRHLRGGLSLEEAVVQAKTSTRKAIKRAHLVAGAGVALAGLTAFQVLLLSVGFEGTSFGRPSK
jgi:tRNA dimethylallyltransferase